MKFKKIRILLVLMILILFLVGIWIIKSYLNQDPNNTCYQKCSEQVRNLSRNSSCGDYFKSYPNLTCALTENGNARMCSYDGKVSDLIMESHSPNGIIDKVTRFCF